VTRDDATSVGSGAYVLNAMDQDERNIFEAQLAESEELRNEVTELTDTAVLLGMAVAPVTPSPELRDTVMSKIAALPQLSRDIAPVRSIHTGPVALSLAAEPPAQLNYASAMLETNAKARQRWYQRPVLALTAAAAAVVLIAGTVAGVNAGIQGADQQQAAAALTSVVTASDAQRAEASVSTGGTATLVWSSKLGKSALIVHGLKSLPSDKTYELWYINSKGTPTKAGLMEPTGKSTSQVLTGKMANGDTVGVTVEPAGGSTTPTTKPIVAIPSA
jgi:anti-sigma-K factor RskA